MAAALHRDADHGGKHKEESSGAHLRGGRGIWRQGGAGRDDALADLGGGHSRAAAGEGHGRCVQQDLHQSAMPTLSPMARRAQSTCMLSGKAHAALGAVHQMSC